MKFPIREDNYDRENGNEHFIFGIETVLEYAANIPPADVVAVVRCKDCGYYNAEKGVCIGIPTEPVVKRNPNEFCSRGAKIRGNVG